MTVTNTICAMAILSIGIAAPAIARDTGRHHSRIHHGPIHSHLGYQTPQFQQNTENYGFGGLDHSRIGGEDPDLHPSAY